MMVRQSGSETWEGLCSEGTLLVCSTLKRAAFDLLEMPQVIVFQLKVVLQETSGMLSALGLNWGKDGGVGDKKCCCVVHVSYKTVDVYLQAVSYFIVLVCFPTIQREEMLLYRAMCFSTFISHTYSTLGWCKERENNKK